MSQCHWITTQKLNDEGPLSKYCLGRRGQFRYPPDCHKFVNCGDGGAMAYLQTWGAIQYTLKKHHIIMKIFSKVARRNHEISSLYYKYTFQMGLIATFSVLFLNGLNWTTAPLPTSSSTPRPPTTQTRGATGRPCPGWGTLATPPPPPPQQQQE